LLNLKRNPYQNLSKFKCVNCNAKRHEPGNKEVYNKSIDYYESYMFEVDEIESIDELNFYMYDFEEAKNIIFNISNEMTLPVEQTTRE
jgi:hypothetical protein